ncbi:MAG TPA: Ig-like domain-containing protein [Mycobacterium sp.]|nr:Ig-like domain-containing protein [Mycobacterium sp.]
MPTHIGVLLFWSRRVRVTAAAAAAAAVVLLAGDVADTTPHCSTQCQVASAAQTVSAPKPQPPQPAALGVFPKAQAADVDPASPVSVAAFRGTIDTVEMVNDWGETVPGALTPGRTGWHPTEQLKYGRTYTMTVAARGPGGMPTRQTSSFTTLSPESLTNVNLNTLAGFSLVDGSTYGVGTVIKAYFDDPITDKVAAEKRLHVTSSVPVNGSWNWISDYEAHWRPEKYWPANTSVDVTADIYGANLGDGMYGEADKHVSFKIGNAHVSVADDKTKQVSVFDNGRLVRTMPTSMGMGGTQVVNGKELHFWTPPGTYAVLDKANPVVMDSTTYGLTGGGGYRTTVNYATRISMDGIYLHQLNETVWAQGNTNVSHGCLNLNSENARWFFDFAQPGDIVEVRNTGGPPLTVAQGGDWSVPWDQWRKGSALNA